MVSGKATGSPRAYQVKCAAWLARMVGAPLLPYRDDGIDVPFTMGGTTWRLDVALRYLGGGLVVAECKRYRPGRPVEQEEVAAFAYKLILLRQLTRTSVAGYFFANASYRRGAVQAAQGAGIKPYTVNHEHDPISFAVIYEEVVKVGRQRLHRHNTYGYMRGGGGSGGIATPNCS